jgi:RNA polymerase sigma-70 factor, ECF subfamily
MGSRRDRKLDEIEALYRSRFPLFVQVARGIVGDPERAQEAVQDGFASAIKNRDRFRGEGPLEAWVWRAVVNAARRATRRPLVEVGVAAKEAYEPSADQLEASPLVARLPERQRLIVFLRYYAGLDYRAIAAALDLEIGTVSAALATAHASIRRALEKVESQ